MPHIKDSIAASKVIAIASAERDKYNIAFKYSAALKNMSIGRCTANVRPNIAAITVHTSVANACDKPCLCGIFFPLSP